MDINIKTWLVDIQQSIEEIMISWVNVETSLLIKMI
jgi:hypothetical protein